MNAAAALALLLGPISSQAAVVTGGFIFDGNRFNWAPDGAPTQSTTGFGGEARLAIDGITDGNYGGGSVSHTDAVTAFSFWQVDLGINRPIDQIVLWNRTDCCGDRLSNFNVSVTDALNAVVFSQNYYVGAGSVGVNEVVNLPATINGKVVKVQFLGPSGLNNSNEPSLSLAEVQLFNNHPTSFTNLALGKTTLMSSEGFGGAASRGVDGNTDGRYGNNSVTHTASLGAVPVFWEVDLGGDFGINDISLWNRVDCCMARLSNFRVSIFDGPTEVWGNDYFTVAGTSVAAVFSILEDTGGFFAIGDRVRVSLIGGVNGSPEPIGGGKDLLSLAEVQVFGAAVPEPSALVAVLGGLAVLGVRRRRSVDKTSG
jgi:NedA-like, galactose-binding domain